MARVANKTAPKAKKVPKAEAGVAKRAPRKAAASAEVKVKSLVGTIEKQIEAAAKKEAAAKAKLQDVRDRAAKNGTKAAKAAVIKADRKSTRLNSSHVKISYAVFCLKKKTTQNTKKYS